MPRRRVKICGLSTAATVDAAIANDASHIGLNFFAPSPRYVGLDQAAGLAARMPDEVERVGVYVDPDDALIEASITAGRLTALQLHKTTPVRIAAIRERTGVPIWAVVAVKTSSDLDQAAGYVGAADFILYDAKTPDDATLPGGMGVRFDWRLMDGFRSPLPWGLSGGLTPDNVADAIRQTNAPLVDVSSGVETAPGMKDAALIMAFLKAVASA
ncbi:MAG: phosphoribosylanthranilate isomerase [Sphingomonas sp.]